MTDQEKMNFKKTAVRFAQQAVRDHVNDLQAKRGLSFQTAWATAQRERPDLFRDLSKAADALSTPELNQIDQGDDYTQDYPPYEAPKIKNNVPDTPTSRPHPTKSKDPRITPEMARQNPDRPRDARIRAISSSKPVLIQGGGFATRLVD